MRLHLFLIWAQASGALLDKSGRARLYKRGQSETTYEYSPLSQNQFIERHSQRINFSPIIWSSSSSSYFSNEEGDKKEQNDASRENENEPSKSPIQNHRSPWNEMTPKKTANHGAARRNKRRLYGASKRGWRNLSNLEKITPSHSNVEEFLSSITGERDLQGAAMYVCNQAIVQEEQVGADYGTKCSCSLAPASGTSTLTCTDMDCGYCNQAGTVCERYSYGVVFNQRGQDISFFEKDDFIFGRSGSVVYTETQNGCSIEVDGQECNMCGMTECNDGYYGIQVQCQNIPDAGSFSSCNPSYVFSGAFEVFNENAFSYCFSSNDACERDIINVSKEYDCTCNEQGGENTNLDCKKNCQYCNPDISVCAQEDFTQIYSASALQATRKKIKYTRGRDQVVVFEQSHCDASGCEDCSFQMNGLECNKCKLQTCTNGQQAPSVNCENLEPGTTFDFCTQTAIENNLFEYFSQGSTDSCTSVGEIACTQAKANFQDDGYDCTCDLSQNQYLDDSLRLTCRSKCGDRCNDKKDVCFRETVVYEFENSELDYVQKDIQYTLGRREALRYEEGDDGVCFLSIDSTPCNSCRLQDCPLTATGKAPILDCSNIESGSVFNLCNDNLEIDHGVFELFSSNEFQECRDQTPSNVVCSSGEVLSSIEPEHPPTYVSGSTMVVEYDGSLSCGEESSSPGLWYTISGSGFGLKASTCHGETDFNATISVYSGSSCIDLNCADVERKDDCSVNWFGEAGVEYYIRVHGRGPEKGNFGLTLGEIDYSDTGCSSLFEILAAPDKKCECASFGHEASLACSVNCALCNSHGDVCVERSEMWKVGSSGNVVGLTKTFEYTSGRNENIVFTQSRCSDESLSDCQECELSIDDIMCESCQVVVCGDRGIKGIAAFCQDAGVQTPLNTCNPSTPLDGVYQVLTSPDYDKCFSRDVFAACINRKVFEEMANEDLSCRCTEQKTGDIMLSCVDKSCLLCDSRHTLCGYAGFGSTFDDVGRVVSNLSGFQYVEGRHDFVAFHEPLGHSESLDECKVTVNDNACSSCSSVTCNGHNETFLGFSVECENVEAGFSFDGCYQLPSVKGVFEFLSEDGFSECVDTHDPFDTCMLTRDETMGADPSLDTSCACQELGRRRFGLLCSDYAECYYCDQEKRICASYYQYGASINRFGIFTSFTDTFVYIKGRADILSMEDDGVGCSVKVNGETCQGCEHVDCGHENPGPGVNYAIDCSNIMDNATYVCGEGDELFSVFSGELYYSCEASGFATNSTGELSEFNQAKDNNTQAKGNNTNSTIHFDMRIDTKDISNGRTQLTVYTSILITFTFFALILMF